MALFVPESKVKVAGLNIHLDDMNDADEIIELQEKKKMIKKWFVNQRL